MRVRSAVYSFVSVLILATIACAGRRPTQGVESLLQWSKCDGVLELTVSNYTPKDLTLVARTTVLQAVVGTVPPGVHSYEVQPSAGTWYEALSVDGKEVIARESPPPHWNTPIGSVSFERTCRSSERVGPWYRRREHRDLSRRLTRA